MKGDGCVGGGPFGGGPFGGGAPLDCPEDALLCVGGGGGGPAEDAPLKSPRGGVGPADQPNPQDPVEVQGLPAGGGPGGGDAPAEAPEDAPAGTLDDAPLPDVQGGVLQNGGADEVGCPVGFHGCSDGKRMGTCLGGRIAAYALVAALQTGLGHADSKCAKHGGHNSLLPCTPFGGDHPHPQQSRHLVFEWK